jgi:hypothetical protein
MGYDTVFNGKFVLNKRLDLETYQFLVKLSGTRRMARSLPEEYGVEGEFYVDGGGCAGQAREDNIIDFNTPPKTQPSLWCEWCPTEDGLAIEWNDAEKFYHYIEWIKYLIERILQPRGYVLNGDVRWQGQSCYDAGCVSIKDNVVIIKKGKDCSDCKHRLEGLINRCRRRYGPDEDN